MNDLYYKDYNVELTYSRTDHPIMSGKGISDAEYGLRMTLGMDLFREGLGICERGDVSGSRTLDGDIRLFDVKDGGVVHRVIERTRMDGTRSFDCDCGDGTCGHIAASMMLPHLPFGEAQRADAIDDCDAMGRILGMIEDIDDEVSSDSDFDERAWTYGDEFWYVERYGSEGIDMNDQVSYDVASDIYHEIVTGLVSADSVVRMLNALANHDGDYTGDGPTEVLADHRKEVDVYLSCVSPEAVADCIRDFPEYGSWILDVCDRLGDGVLKAAVGILDSRGYSSGIVDIARSRL